MYSVKQQYNINAMHIFCVHIDVSTVTDTPISSISILSSTIVSTSLITSTQKMMPATSNVVPRETPTGMLVLCCYIV